MTKRIVLSAVVVAALATGAIVAFLWITAPPSNEDVIRAFNAHRQAFQQLRDMLWEDDHVVQVASWGVRTVNAPIAHPPVPELSLERYQRYLELFSRAEALAAARSPGTKPDICILVWARGWAGDTGHIAMCWLGRHPIKPEGPEADDRFTYYPVAEHWFIQKEI